jgi:hypothetical protein
MISSITRSSLPTAMNPPIIRTRPIGDHRDRLFEPDGLHCSACCAVQPQSIADLAAIAATYPIAVSHPMPNNAAPQLYQRIVYTRV